MTPPGWLYLFSSNSSPHYEQDVLNVLALPGGSRYTFAYDARHVEERALEHWLKLTGRRVVVLYALQQEAEYLPAALIPVRLGTVLSTRSIGSHRYVEFRLEEYAALPAIPPKQRPGPLVRTLSKYFADLSETPYDAWASIGDPIPVGMDVAVPWDSDADAAQRFERIVAYLEHTVSFNDARFFRFGHLAERGAADLLELTGDPPAFDVEAGRTYELLLIQYQGTRRITDRVFFSVGADGSALEVIGQPVFEIASRYDEISVPLHARDQTSYGVRETVLRIDPAEGAPAGPRIELRFRVQTPLKGAIAKTTLSTIGLFAIGLPAVLGAAQFDLWKVLLIGAGALITAYLQVFGLTLPPPLTFPRAADDAVSTSASGSGARG